MRNPSDIDMSLYAGIKPDKLPKKWYEVYLVYQYAFTKPMIIGYEDESVANCMQEEFLTRDEIVRCEIFGHFPRELL